jgi:hypothetical protein
MFKLCLLQPEEKGRKILGDSPPRFSQYSWVLAGNIYQKEKINKAALLPHIK